MICPTPFSLLNNVKRLSWIDMPRFYVTFGQKSPFRDGYVVIIADDEHVAHDEAMYVLGKAWSSLYSEDAIEFGLFIQGQIGRTIELPKGYKHTYE